MKLSLFLGIIFIVTACHESNKQSRDAKPEMVSKVDRPVHLSYYKCDYSMRSYDTIFMAGSEDSITEIWGVIRSDINEFPNFDPRSIDTTYVLKSAMEHLKNRFSDINIFSSTFKLERINDQDTASQNNWFIDITFLYDERGYFQKVPILLDGRIILSNDE